MPGPLPETSRGTAPLVADSSAIGTGSAAHTVPCRTPAGTGAHASSNGGAGTQSGGGGRCPRRFCRLLASTVAASTGHVLLAHVFCLGHTGTHCRDPRRRRQRGRFRGEPARRRFLPDQTGSGTGPGYVCHQHRGTRKSSLGNQPGTTARNRKTGVFGALRSCPIRRDPGEAARRSRDGRWPGDRHHVRHCHQRGAGRRPSGYGVGHGTAGWSHQGYESGRRPVAACTDQPARPNRADC